MTFINQEVADFTVNAYHDGTLTTVSKKDTLGKWAIFFFYPADFSFVCPTELGDMADHYEQFQSANAEVYSVSEDTEFVHQAWSQATPTIGKIKYPMLADPAGTLARFFDVLDTTAGQAFRATIIVDPQGIIQSYQVNNMGIGRNAEEVLRTLEAAQFVAEHGDHVCPANWHPGDDSIIPSLDLIGKI